MKRRKIRTLALYVDVHRKAAVTAARRAARIAADAGVKLRLPVEQARVLGISVAASPAPFPRSADLLISLGGDGTLLRAAHFAFAAGVPIVGVDFGTMGFLAEVRRQDFARTLKTLLSDGMETAGRTALEARVNGAPTIRFALNDVHIDRSDRGHTITFGIHISNERVADIPADGIVVSSPTGSTAYFLSAGGPIIAPRLDAFGIAPICPHTLFSRPLVVSAAEIVRITIPDNASGAKMYADGRHAADLPPGAAVEIRRAPRQVEFLRVDNHYFFQVLERKLHWGPSIKQSLARDGTGSAGRDGRTYGGRKVSQ